LGSHFLQLFFLLLHHYFLTTHITEAFPKKPTKQEKGKHIYVVGILMECLSMLHSTFFTVYMLSHCHFELTTLSRRVAACINK
jgi:hypothetical protein